MFCLLGIKDAVMDGDRYIVDFKTERLLNVFCSRNEPFCCLCAIFSSNPVNLFCLCDC